MKHPEILFTAVVMMLSFALSPAAMAWKKEYKEGKDYLKRSAYLQAVEKFEEALADESLQGGRRKSAEALLAEAKSEAAGESFQRGLRFIRNNDLPKARQALRIAVEYAPGNRQYAEKFNEVNADFKETEQKIAGSYTKGVLGKQWDQAISELASYAKYESAFPDIHAKIADLKVKASAHFLADSNEKLYRQNYPGAYRSIELALKYSSTQDLQNKQRARHHLVLSQEAWKSNNYLKAYEEIDKGLGFESDNEELKEYRQRLTDEWGGILYNEAVAASNDGRYAQAKARLTQLSQFMPGFLDSAGLLSEVSSTIASTYYEKAGAIMRSGSRDRIGTAVAYYLLVKEEHSPLYPDIEEKLEEAKKSLARELEFRISLNFENRSTEPGADGLIKEQLLSKLKNAPSLKHLSILDRGEDAISDILREQGLGQGFLDESTAIEVKKIKGIQAGIRGEVIKISVKESGRERPSYGSQRYVSGTRWVPNPDYQMVQADVQAAQQRVLQAQADYNQAQAQQNQMMAQQQAAAANNPYGAIAAGLSGALGQIGVTNAKRDLDHAQSQLASTPAQIEEDVYADFRYEIYDLKLHGEVVISFKVINYTTSEIGQVRTVRKEETLTDRYIPGDPSKGVASDTSDLPTGEQFKNRLMSAAIEDAFKALQEELAQSARSYYELAQKAQRGGIEDETVENYMRFIYSAPDLADDKVHEANEYLYQSLGLSVIRRRGS